VRTSVVSCTLVAGLLALAMPPHLAAQGLFSDARSVGMGGVSLSIDAGLSRYNAAYRSVPSRSLPGGPKLSIPVPLGLIQFFHDHPISSLSKDPLFHPDSAGFNPVNLLNLVLNPPLFYDLKKPPTPTNDVAFGVGKDSLQVVLGATAQLIPSDQFGFAGSSRPLAIEPSFHGVQPRVLMW